MPRFLVNLIFSIIFPTRLFGLKRWLFRIAGMRIGGGVKLNSECKVFGHGYVEIGADTWIGIGCEIHVPYPAKVVIGSRCDIAPRVLILCGSHLVGNHLRRAGLGTTEDILVGAGVWIGAGAMLLPGAVLGDGIVVAAGSVVLRGNYPANSLLAGNPAFVQKKYEN